MVEPTSICDDCHAGCCRSFAVPITGADVLQIEQSTGLDFWDFACRWEDQEGLIAGSYVPRLYFEDEPQTPFTLCLMHTASQQYPETTRCLFLREHSPYLVGTPEKGRCSIYQARPLACRVFPLSLNKSSQLTILDQIPEQGRSATPSETSQREAYQLCPRPWELSDVNSISGPQHVAVAKFEAEFFSLMVESWNRQPGSWLKFPEFLRLVYSQRVMKAKDQQTEVDDGMIIPMSRAVRTRRVA